MDEIGDEPSKLPGLVVRIARAKRDVDVQARRAGGLWKTGNFELFQQHANRERCLDHFVEAIIERVPAPRPADSDR